MLLRLCNNLSLAYAECWPAVVVKTQHGWNSRKGTRTREARAGCSVVKRGEFRVNPSGCWWTVHRKQARRSHLKWNEQQWATWVGSFQSLHSDEYLGSLICGGQLLTGAGAGLEPGRRAGARFQTGPSAANRRHAQSWAVFGWCTKPVLTRAAWHGRSVRKDNVSSPTICLP